MFHMIRRSIRPVLSFGLGLAVVRAVAQAHGGRVAVLARREGGLEVTVSLPLAPADAAEPVVTAPARA